MIMSQPLTSNTGVSLGITNPKSPTNMGIVMRAAGCFQVDAIYYTGERYAKAARFHTDTHNTSRKIPLSGVDSLLDCVGADVKVVCVELVEGAIPLPEFEHPANAIYIFGPEDGTIKQDVLDQAHAVVYIPTVGCLNLAATVNVLLYDRLAKSANPIGGDELIRSSRDIKNNTKLT
ncbi:MAG: RNA methyltransferase [Bermanella sp.]